MIANAFFVPRATYNVVPSGDSSAVLAPRVANNEQMPDRIHIRRHKGQHQFWQSLQLIQIVLGYGLPPGVPLIEFCQLYPQKGGLKLVET